MSSTIRSGRISRASVKRLDAVGRLDEAIARAKNGPDELAQARVVVADENRRGVEVGCGLWSWFVHRTGRGGGAGSSKSSR